MLFTASSYRKDERNIASLSNRPLLPSTKPWLGVKKHLLAGRTGPKEGEAWGGDEHLLPLELPAPLDE